MTRQQICASTSQKLASAAAKLGSVKALIGFDGFVDSIIAVVDKRQDAENYTPVRTIADFGKKITTAAGQSSNYEMLVKLQKLGGNGPIMANALAAAGMGVTYIGNLGYPQPHPVFDDFRKRANVISIAEPGYTDALEFDDGKLMLGKHQHMRDVNWQNLVDRVGEDKLKKFVAESKLIGCVNWTMLPFMSELWEKLLSQVLPGLGGDRRTLFVDLADPEKRTHGDILRAMNLLTKFQSQVDVILGMNLKESAEILEVLGLPKPEDAKAAEAAIEDTAQSIRTKLNLNCAVVHPRKGAAAATSDHAATFHGPFVEKPKISTGAGDHFNAGFCLGRTLGMSIEESLCTGCGTSGYYVRSAISPSATQLAEFIATMPDPQA